MIDAIPFWLWVYAGAAVLGATGAGFVGRGVLSLYDQADRAVEWGQLHRVRWTAAIWAAALLAAVLAGAVYGRAFHGEHAMDVERGAVMGLLGGCLAPWLSNDMRALQRSAVDALAQRLRPKPPASTDANSADDTNDA